MGRHEEDFKDPLVRCDQCSKLTHRAFITKYGGCFHCGNKRFRNVTAFSEDEYNALKSGTMKIGIDQPYNLDSGFLDEFEATQGADSEEA
jgi:predicted  nucleic acid-binding Zn-ribbon protein